MRISFTTFDLVDDFDLVMTVADVQYEGTCAGAISETHTESGGVLTATSDHRGRNDSVTQDGHQILGAGDLFVEIVPARRMDSLPCSSSAPTLVLGAGPVDGARTRGDTRPGPGSSHVEDPPIDHTVASDSRRW